MNEETEKVLEILVNFANAMEAASVDLKHSVKEVVGIEKMAPSEVKYDSKDFDSLKWETKEGTKASYQQTTKEANQNNDVFQALKKILQSHKGFWQNSSHKYWFHQNNENIIDRRRK